MTEHDIQKAFFTLLSMHTTQYPELALFHAIPNGGARNPIVGKKLKAEGVRPGVCDTFLPVARGGYHGLYIEFKTPCHRNRKNGGLSDKQADFIAAVREQAYYADTFYTAEEAIEITLRYLRLLPVAGSNIHEVIEEMPLHTAIGALQNKIADVLQVLAESGKQEMASVHNANTYELCKSAIERAKA